MGESFWEGCEPLLPDVCMTQVWQEAPLTVRWAAYRLICCVVVEDLCNALDSHEKRATFQSKCKCWGWGREGEFKNEGRILESVLCSSPQCYSFFACRPHQARNQRESHQGVHHDRLVWRELPVLSDWPFGQAPVRTAVYEKRLRFTVLSATVVWSLFVCCLFSWSCPSICPSVVLSSSVCPIMVCNHCNF